VFSDEFCRVAVDCIQQQKSPSLAFQFNDQSILFTKLYGDASHKTFYRFTYQDQTYVLVYIPDGIPASEETFCPPHERLSQGQIFAETGAWLQRHVNHVPRLYAVEDHYRGFIMTDGGDVTLHDQAQPPQQAYFACIDWLIALQQQTRKLTGDSIIHQRVFNHDALLTELQEFIEFSPTQDSEQHAHRFDDLAKAIAKQPQTIIHRDYQSKNILLDQGEIMIIDSQDMCMGSIYYDVASLLYDPYVNLDDVLIAAGMDYFHTQLVAVGLIDQDREQTREAIQLNAAQRLYKAAGRYQRIHQLKGNDNYLQYYDGAVRRANALLTI